MEDTIKIVRSLKKSELIIKGISETIKNNAKEKKLIFLTLLLGTLADSMLGTALAEKVVIKACEDL